MRPTQELVEEHAVIERVLDALAHKVEEAERTGTVPAQFLRNLVDFSRSFVDRCHHAKEEQCLFPCLEQRGLPRAGGPIAVMLEEHEMGRALVREIAAALDRHGRGDAAPGDVLSPCRQYVALLRAHILKENGVLFPMGESLMGPSDDRQTGDCFAGAERAAGDRASWMHLAETLAGNAQTRRGSR